MFLKEDIDFNLRYDPVIKLGRASKHHFPVTHVNDYNNWYMAKLLEEWSLNRNIYKDNSEEQNKLLSFCENASKEMKNRFPEHEFTDYRVLNEYIPEEYIINVEKLSYRINLSWIKNVDIYIIETVDNNTDCIPCLKNDNILTKTDYSVIEQASIIFLNIDGKPESVIKKNLLHELKHFYDFYFRGYEYGKSDYGYDLDLGLELSDYNRIDLSKLNISSNIKNWNLNRIELYIGEILYWINDKEIYAHLENIFEEMSDYFSTNQGLLDDFLLIEDASEKEEFVRNLKYSCSKTYCIYLKIFKLLQKLEILTDEKECEMFFNKWNSKFNKVYKRNFRSFADIIKFLTRQDMKCLKHADKYFMKFYGNLIHL